MKKKASRKKRKEENAEGQKNLIRPAEEVVPKKYGAFKFFEHEHGTSISFDLEDWHKPTFLKVLNKIPGLTIIENKQIHKSIAPALVYEDFITTLGTLHVDRDMDEFPGCTIASDNKQLMTLVVKHLVSFGYEMRPVKVTPTSTVTGAPKESMNFEELTLYPFSYYEHDNGATISFDLDSFNPDDLFNELKKIPGFEIVKKESLYSSFGPLESASEYFTIKGNFTLANTWEGMDTGHTISSPNKELIKLIIEQLRRSSLFSENITNGKNETSGVQPEVTPAQETPNDAAIDDTPQPPKTKKEEGCGGTMVAMVFLFLTLYLITLAFNFYSNSTIDLSHADKHSGKVTHASISTKGATRKSTGFNLEVEGLAHRFRFFKGNFTDLKEKLKPGTFITIYYQSGSSTVYQIESANEIILRKELFESSQWPGVIMSFIFAFVSGFVTWFLMNQK